MPSVKRVHYSFLFLSCMQTETLALDFDCSKECFPLAKFSSRVNTEKTSPMQSMVAGTRPARSAGKAWYLLVSKPFHVIQFMVLVEVTESFLSFTFVHQRNVQR